LCLMSLLRVYWEFVESLLSWVSQSLLNWVWWEFIEFVESLLSWEFGESLLRVCWEFVDNLLKWVCWEFVDSLLRVCREFVETLLSVWSLFVADIFLMLLCRGWVFVESLLRGCWVEFAENWQSICFGGELVERLWKVCGWFAAGDSSWGRWLGFWWEFVERLLSLLRVCWVYWEIDDSLLRVGLTKCLKQSFICSNRFVNKWMIVLNIL
jgi:hypothetical protein